MTSSKRAVFRSIAATDSGFIYAMDRRTARRQWQMSLGIVIVLGIAIIAAALTLQTGRASKPAYAVFLPEHMLHAESSVGPANRI